MPTEPMFADDFDTLDAWDAAGAIAENSIAKTLTGQHATMRYLPESLQAASVVQSVTLGPVGSLTSIGLQAFGEQNNVWVDGRFYNFGNGAGIFAVARQSFTQAAQIIAASPEGALPDPQPGDRFEVWTSYDLETEEYRVDFGWRSAGESEGFTSLWHWIGRIDGADAIVGTPRLRLHPGAQMDAWTATV